MQVIYSFLLLWSLFSEAERQTFRNITSILEQPSQILTYFRRARKNTLSQTGQGRSTWSHHFKGSSYYRSPVLAWRRFLNFWTHKDLFWPSQLTIGPMSNPRTTKFCVIFCHVLGNTGKEAKCFRSLILHRLMRIPMLWWIYCLAFIYSNKEKLKHIWHIYFQL